MCISPTVLWYASTISVYSLGGWFLAFLNILNKILGQNELCAYEQRLDILLSDNQFKHQVTSQSTKRMYYCISVSLFVHWLDVLKCLFYPQRSASNFFHFLQKIYELFIKLWSCFYLPFSDPQKMASVMPRETHQSILMADISSVQLVQENCQVSLGKLNFVLGEWIIYDKHWMIVWKKLLFVNCISASSSFLLHNGSSQFLQLLLLIYIYLFIKICCIVP